jgi:hypothetical protein
MQWVLGEGKERWGGGWLPEARGSQLDDEGQFEQGLESIFRCATLSMANSLCSGDSFKKFTISPVVLWVDVLNQPHFETLGGKSISTGAQYVTLAKYFSHPSSVMYSSATRLIKLRLGQQIGGGLLIAKNHMDQSLWWANQKHWAAVRSYLLHSSLHVHSCAW